MPSHQARINRLHRTISDRHRCDSLHEQTVPLNLQDGENAVWSGHVEVFELIGHPIATLCYAWIQPIGAAAHRNRVITVMAIPPIISPELAVRSYLHSRGAP